MNEIDIYKGLNAERNLVTSPDSGHVVKKEAWDRIDNLLDQLNEARERGSLVVGQIIEVHEVQA